MSKEKQLKARKDLGLFFAERRKEMGHSCKALADFIGITESTMQRIEDGNLDFELSLLFRICEALEIKPFFEALENEQLACLEPILEDAHAMSLMHCATFKAPTNEQLKQLKAGSLVKVNASGERFWTKVETIDFETKSLIAIVDNELVNYNEHGLKLGDVIKFKFHNIYTIYED